MSRAQQITTKLRSMLNSVSSSAKEGDRLLVTSACVALVLGTIVAALMHDTRGRERQESAHDLLVKFFKTHDEWKQRRERVRAAKREKLLFSTTSGNAESGVEGVSVTAHPNGGFVIRGDASPGLVWRSALVKVHKDKTYRVVFDGTPFEGVRARIVVNNPAGQSFVSAVVSTGVERLQLAVRAPSGEVLVGVVLEEKTEFPDIIWIRKVSLLEINK